jgi:hypothetical protein
MLPRKVWTFHERAWGSATRTTCNSYNYTNGLVPTPAGFRLLFFRCIRFLRQATSCRIRNERVAFRFSAFVVASCTACTRCETLGRFERRPRVDSNLTGRTTHEVWDTGSGWCCFSLAGGCEVAADLALEEGRLVRSVISRDGRSFHASLCGAGWVF